MTRSTVKRLQTVEPPGDVIRNTKSPFYSSNDRQVSFTLKKKNGWMSPFPFLATTYATLNRRVEGVCLHCIELSLWCNRTYFVGRFDMYDYDFYLLFTVILSLSFNGFRWLLS